MKVDLETIKRLSHLARLRFDDNEKKEIQGDLQRIVDFCEQLDSVDTEGVDPLIYMTEELNQLRDDVVKPSLPKERALKNAPSADSDYFRIPKVIKK
jgi:aspartyl-tRNA(Asn)/glutamyl-tRNA(Gln) amidotransferase subunit C